MKKELIVVKDILIDSVIVGAGVLAVISGIACYVGDIAKYSEQ